MRNKRPIQTTSIVFCFCCHNVYRFFTKGKTDPGRSFQLYSEYNTLSVCRTESAMPLNMEQISQCFSHTSTYWITPVYSWTSEQAPRWHSRFALPVVVYLIVLPVWAASVLQQTCPRFECLSHFQHKHPTKAITFLPFVVFSLLLFAYPSSSFSY